MKKKILIYTGNHRYEVGILDYLQTLIPLIEKLGFVAIKSSSFKDLILRDFDAVIVIEEFSTNERLITTNLIIKNFRGQKILILTEFFNEERNTLNSFDNILKNENSFFRPKYSLFLYLQKIRSYCSRNFFLSLIIYFFSKFFEILKKLSFFLFGTIPVSIFRAVLISSAISYFYLGVNKLSATKFLRYVAIKTRKIIFKFKLIKKKLERLGKTEKEFDSIRDEIYMKLRYFGLANIINTFDAIFVSHKDILPIKLLNKKIPIEQLYFNLKKDKIDIDKNNKIKLSFSGYLNEYRLETLINLCKDKNDFFDYSEIDKIIKYSKPRFIKQFHHEKNYCSIHIKKTKNWLYSSPTRYINSINKNEIPLILEDFSDEDSKLLTLKAGSLNAKNWNEFEKEIDELNNGIKRYRMLLNNNEQSLKKFIGKLI